MPSIRAWPRRNGQTPIATCSHTCGTSHDTKVQHRKWRWPIPKKWDKYDSDGSIPFFLLSFFLSFLSVPDLWLAGCSVGYIHTYICTAPALGLCPRRRDQRTPGLALSTAPHRTRFPLDHPRRTRHHLFWFLGYITSAIEGGSRTPRCQRESYETENWGRDWAEDCRQNKPWREQSIRLGDLAWERGGKDEVTRTHSVWQNVRRSPYVSFLPRLLPAVDG